ncbi:hypothetical protein Hanom_Chr09g00854891 [Helianthus anomalus]
MALIPICHTPTNGGNIGVRRKQDCKRLHNAIDDKYSFIDFTSLEIIYNKFKSFTTNSHIINLYFIYVM